MHSDEMRKQYSVEMEDDLDINIANVLQKQLAAPGIKHKWLHRLGQERVYLFKLQKEQEEIINSLVNDNRVTLTKPALEAKAKGVPRYKEISDEITHQSELID
ncbi:MAG TPA: hypothetical protein PKU78_06575, partial [Candidatus Dojkabacteria bacterium]|nr:hypothetical protein [Candidatus Dojkabacteria bacterium]